MKAFCNLYKLKVKEPTSFESFNNRSCTAFFLTAPKQLQKFEKLLILETGMLNSYKLIVNTLKIKPLEQLQKI